MSTTLDLNVLSLHEASEAPPAPFKTTQPHSVIQHLDHLTAKHRSHAPRTASAALAMDDLAASNKVEKAEGKVAHVVAHTADKVEAKLHRTPTPVEKHPADGAGEATDHKKDDTDAKHDDPDDGETEVALYPQMGAQEWTVEIQIGSKKVAVAIDTGSADLILPALVLDLSTAHNTGKKFKIGYVDGTTAQGQIYKDEFRIGDLSPVQVAFGVSPKPFLEPEEYNGKDAKPPQGIIGLAFPGISSFPKKHALPFFDRLMEAKVLDKHVFSCVFEAGKPYTPTPGLRNEFTVGSISEQAIAHTTPVPVDSAGGGWKVPVTIGTLRGHALMDTGTTLIAMSLVALKKLMSEFPPSNYEVVPLDKGYHAVNWNEKSPPKIDIKVGSLTVRLPEEAVILGQDEKGRTQLSIVAIEPWFLPDSYTWIFGGVYLRSVVSIWSREGDTPHFSAAPHKGTQVEA